MYYSICIHNDIHYDIHIDKYFTLNQGHGHEEFLQGGGHGGSWVVVTVPGTGTKDGIPTKHWIYSNQTGDTMVIDRGFFGKDEV